MYENGNKCFTLRIPDGHDGSLIMITAWDNAWPRIDVEVRHKGSVVFPRGQLYCAGPRHGGWPSDGPRMRGLVCSLVSMQLGDTDRDYFEGYTQAQLDWVTEHGEWISMVALDRYGEG